MIKKTMIVLAMTLVVAVGILSVVNTTYAQELSASVDTLDPNLEPEEASYAYQNAFQYGEGNGDHDPELTQTRTRTQLRDLQDGECTGDGEPQQLRINQGAGNQGLRRQQQKSLQDGSCNGDCVQLNQGGQGQ
jgi:hypothetical protein